MENNPIEALEFIERQSTRVQPIYHSALDDENSVRIMVAAPGMDSEVLEIQKPPPTVSHHFGTIDDLTTFLKSEDCKAHGVIFVNPVTILEAQDTNARRFVECNLSYGKHSKLSARVPLTFTDEFLALMELSGGVTQKVLWRLLQTNLHGNMDAALLLSIARLKIKASSESHAEISLEGLTDRATEDKILIEANGKADTLGVEWTWNGRIFECSETTHEVVTRLEVSERLVFTFHPRHLQTALTDATALIAKDIMERVPEHFDTYVGTE